MSDFTIRSESVDVEQIMKQIRTRILEKRGADYTEDQIRELATVRLEKFLDPNNLRSDLLEQFRKSRPARRQRAAEDRGAVCVRRSDAVCVASRAAAHDAQAADADPQAVLQSQRAQPDPAHAGAVQRRPAEARGAAPIEFDRSRAEWNSLYYEVLHNLVLETTRMGIEVQNLRMKIESLSSRLDFSERRVRALEGVVQYRPEAVRAPEHRDDDDHAPAPQADAAGSVEGFVPAGEAQAARARATAVAAARRRRRRGRRGGQVPRCIRCLGCIRCIRCTGAQGAQVPGAGPRGH